MMQPPTADHAQALQTITLIQGIVMTAGAVIVTLLMKSFNAGSKYRDFERANRDISRLASTVNGLPERCRLEMKGELDRYHEFVVEPRFTVMKDEMRRLEEIVDRRRDGDRRRDHD